MSAAPTGAPATAPAVLPASPEEVPVTGDAAVDEAMELLRGVAGTGGPEDAWALAAVHEALQRRLSAPAG